MHRVAAAMADIQRDPRAAMRKYGGDEEVVRFIVGFMRLLGEQMEGTVVEEKDGGVEMKLGTEEGVKGERKGESGAKQRRVDKQQIERWMADPTIRVSACTHCSSTTHVAVLLACPPHMSVSPVCSVCWTTPPPVGC